ncbi:MAG TPA: bifunctional 4-hydroxy-2-oxoglutarate aldolase/2-dehydro-3-deoxy-phosphogluconate aldolase [Candidatus Limnocylindrales bacterium]|nr:bifunctional 4-hydroxy-2-oxoglutarate aldolase/2-dehydro-3-deoxy-phosphogluconate aldolase [Candidatus Limnocylindrales bacterium]
MPVTAPAVRASAAANRIRDARLIAVLRRVEPRAALIDLVADLVDAGVRAVEVTFDAADAADDLVACREAFPNRDDLVLGAGTLRRVEQVTAAVDAGAAFGVSPVLDPDVIAAATAAGLAFVPGAATPTEADRAWRLGATFVKIFPGSALGPSFVRDLRGPLPEIETIVTGGVDASNARAFLDAGAVAVGVGGALVRASATERRALVRAVTAR